MPVFIPQWGCLIKAQGCDGRRLPALPWEIVNLIPTSLKEMFNVPIEQRCNGNSKDIWIFVPSPNASTVKYPLQGKFIDVIPFPRVEGLTGHQPRATIKYPLRGKRLLMPFCKRCQFYTISPSLMVTDFNIKS